MSLNPPTKITHNTPLTFALNVGLGHKTDRQVLPSTDRYGAQETFGVRQSVEGIQRFA